MIKKAFVCVLFFFSFHLYSQDNSPYYLNNTFDKYIEYLINSGKINIQHHLNQPFTTKQLSESIKADSIYHNEYWSTMLQRDLQQYMPLPTKNGELIIGATSAWKLQLVENTFTDNYNITPFVNYNYKNILTHYEYTASTEYLYDSVYFGTTGKLQNQVFGRASTAYLKYNSKYYNIFYGRLNRNYGLSNSLSLIRSYNPYSYDHFSFEIFNKILKYSFSTTRLEDKYSYNIRDSIPVYSWNKRYISFHRLELAFSKKFKLALTESILYGGKYQEPVPAYINPMNIFFLSKMSDRKGLYEGNANSLTAIEFFVKPLKKVSLYVQFLLDDMDFTKELRDKYPDRIGVFSRLAFTDLIPKTQIKLTYIRLSNWTYNSFYTFGNYTYYGKSIGYTKNGFENINLSIDVFKFSKIYFSVLAQFQQEREQNLETHFDYEKTKFPIGISQVGKSISIAINYIPNIYINSSLNVEYQSVSNYQHISNNNRGFVNIYFSFKANGIFSVFSKN